ncbi:DNA topoisomerase IV subunit A [Roseomonas populi]|uniref:DNA topoisomerase 4 subunit A n=1 Tax=Roseomonas populi TaxID=3121582 RepID=A0ABT1WXA4_9PROT|nr:DNA topoisomerase IV subunit A [Roseomonas pecuniae]MCR0980459.1 DNA topoisomerase IV subunit A [Roseomonas pecuniae]
MPDDLKALPEGGRIHETPLAGALSERYLAYAMSTIMARSLPDVRDGLKPVHRRLLWAMQQLRLDPAGGFKKCARVVGDVIGKYHPHGDASVYEALVRLAQDFAARYPLVEGQGNFGNIDGDNAAAMRYTEAKLTEVAKALLEGIDEDAVDFRPTYDGEEQEPVVLPAAFPNLLANGANGIAVGMATSIPPHNAGECCAAALELIRNPEVTTAGLLAHMPGPDFPTGGIMVEPADSVLNAYETGRGGFRLRARWEKEALKNGTWHVVVTEIPYQVQKSRLIEQIAELLEAKKLPLLADVRDESTDKVRLVLEPKSRTVDPAVLMESLFRATPLESRISLNMNVLDADRTPRVMGLKEVLRSWLDHRQVVLVRRSKHRLAAIERRLEILDGYLIVYLNLDEVIRIVREEDHPKEVLMRTFGLTDNQAEAILNMRLRALRKLEEMEIRKEHTRLTKELKGLQKLLSSEKAQWDRIADEIEAARQKFGSGALGDRRTVQKEAVAVVFDESHFVEKEPITVILSEKGWLRAQKGHLEDPSGLRFKEGDSLALLLHAETTDRIGLLASNGRAYTIKADAIPRGRGDGQPVRLMVELGNEDDVLSAFVWREGMKFLLASASGRGFVAKSEDLLAEKRTGKQVLVVDAPDTLAAAVPAQGDTVAVVGENRKLLVFPLEQVPELARGRGVALQGYRDGGLSDVKVFDARREGLTWQLGDRTRTETALAPWRGNRGGAGKMPPTGFPKSNRFDG